MVRFTCFADTVSHNVIMYKRLGRFVATVFPDMASLM